MDIPKRKSNRLESYDYSEPGCYFITICTQNRAKLFELENVGNGLCAVPLQNQIVHKWITETRNKFDNVSVDKYVVMPDHVHMIIRIKERHEGRSLPDVVHYFKTMTTNAYIQGVKKEGLLPFAKRLWQKSYYDHVVRNQADYNEIWEYIDGNPQKWIAKEQG